MSGGEPVFYTTEDVSAVIQWRAKRHAASLKKRRAKLLGVSVSTANEYLTNSFQPGELDGGAVIRRFRTTAAENEFERYRVVQDRLFESDFDRVAKASKALGDAASKPERKGRGEKK
jgi:hypothetical protein